MIPIIPVAIAVGAGILAKCVRDAVNDDSGRSPEPVDTGTLRLPPPGADDDVFDAETDGEDRLRRLEDAVTVLAAAAARGARRDGDALVDAAADDGDRLRRLERTVAALAKSVAGETPRP